jgi:hypothetical protein
MRIAIFLTITIACLLTHKATAKPIPYAGGTTVMLEAGDGMDEAQISYARRAWLSLGPGTTKMQIGQKDATATWIRGNYLLKRWNLSGAQANIFVWGGAGSLREQAKSEGMLNAGAQFDYETRRLYFSVKSDEFRSKASSWRIDTAQMGVAFNAPETDALTSWLVLQERAMHDGHGHSDHKVALLVRLFKQSKWLDIGINERGRPEIMAMLVF